MSRNLPGFVYEFSHLDQFLSQLLKKQGCDFLPLKLCTIKVNISLYYEFICKFSFSDMYFPTHEHLGIF